MSPVRVGEEEAQHQLELRHTLKFTLCMTQGCSEGQTMETLMNFKDGNFASILLK